MSTEACSYWNVAQYIPVSDDPAGVLEPCEAVGGAFSSSDDCDVGLVCWDFMDRWQGTCVPLCGGSPEDPTCPEGLLCATVGNSQVDVCRPMCDPLETDCAEGYACQPWGGGFVCTPVMNQVQEGEPCGPELDCEPGTTCIDGLWLGDCQGLRCCTPYCDLSPEPSVACPPGENCDGFMELSSLPELEDVGICV